jgi:hypothetical protein
MRDRHWSSGIGWGDALALDEFRAVLVKELGHRARGRLVICWKVSVV